MEGFTIRGMKVKTF